MKKYTEMAIESVFLSTIERDKFRDIFSGLTNIIDEADRALTRISDQLSKRGSEEDGISLLDTLYRSISTYTNMKDPTRIRDYLIHSDHARINTLVAAISREMIVTNDSIN